MGVAAMVGLDPQRRCTQARLVYLNAGDGPVVATEAAQALLGTPLTPESIDTAARHAAEKEIAPTPAFQRHLARVLARRAIATAGGRARPPHSSA
jgi:CO/xanthine dehydrogenase FAD-binding subunit